MCARIHVYRNTDVDIYPYSDIDRSLVNKFIAARLIISICTIYFWCCLESKRSIHVNIAMQHISIVISYASVCRTITAQWHKNYQYIYIYIQIATTRVSYLHETKSYTSLIVTHINTLLQNFRMAYSCVIFTRWTEKYQNNLNSLNIIWVKMCIAVKIRLGSRRPPPPITYPFPNFSGCTVEL